MVVMKFGGSSLANAQRFIQAGFLISQQQLATKVAVVLSAISGVTNILATARLNQQVLESLAKVNHKYQQLAMDLAQEFSDIDLATLKTSINQCVLNTQKNFQLLNNNDEQDVAIVTLGERLSVILMLALLEAMQITATHLPAEKIIFVKGKVKEATLDLPRTKQAAQALVIPKSQVTVTEGFYGKHQQYNIGCLGRNGSDLSSAILAIAFKASRLEIWTDVDGVYTADPNLIKQAKLVKTMCFEDLAAFSLLGASVIYAPTLDCIKEYEIPIHIRNTLRPDSSGTWVEYCRDNCSNFMGVCGLKAIRVLSNKTQAELFACDKGGIDYQPILTIPLSKLPKSIEFNKDYSLVSIVGKISIEQQTLLRERIDRTDYFSEFLQFDELHSLSWFVKPQYYQACMAALVNYPLY